MTGRLSRLEFIKLKKTGKNHKSINFSAIVELGSGKFTVVTSSKLEKRAVIRNKLKRRVLSILSKNSKIDAIIFPYKSMLNLSYEEITSEINSFLSKISLI